MSAPEPLVGAPESGAASGELDLEMLYRFERKPLVRQLARRTADPDGAADLVQDIFCRLSRLGRNLTGIDRPKAYLQRAASNRLRDDARERQADGPIAPIEEEDIPSGQDPVAMLESRDMLARVEKALGKLRPRTREIFLAHRALGLSYAEIAQQTGLSIKGVEKQMSKAIAELDRLLARHR